MYKSDMDMLTFTATKSGSDEDDFTLTAGLQQPETNQYVIFQSNASDEKVDYGVYFEFNDQSNGSYNCIASCKVSRGSMLVKLEDNTKEASDISQVEVTLDISESDYTVFLSALKKIFRNSKSTLDIL